MREYRKFNIKSDELDLEYKFNLDEKKMLNSKLNNNSNLNIDDIRRIALWKFDRVISIPDETIKMLNRLGVNENLNHRDEMSIKTIKLLIDCSGVGFPMASSILKFIRPDIYPIIDVRAYRALKGKKIYSPSYKLN